MADEHSDRDKARSEGEAAEIAREMEVLRRHRGQLGPGFSVRRLGLTVVTTALVALVLWLAMR